MCYSIYLSTESDQDSASETTPAKATESPAPTATKKAAPAAAGSQAPATTSSSSDGSDITYVCTHDGSVRTIKVTYPDEGPNVCEVIYEKSTGTQTLWSANSDASYCEDKAIEFIACSGHLFLKKYSFNVKTGEWKYIGFKEEEIDFSVDEDFEPKTVKLSKLQILRALYIKKAEELAVELKKEKGVIFTRDVDEVEEIKFFDYVNKA